MKFTFPDNEDHWANQLSATRGKAVVVDHHDMTVEGRISGVGQDQLGRFLLIQDNSGAMLELSFYCIEEVKYL